MADKKVYYLTGFPNSGKTWLGDYLATRGFHHVDGDGCAQSTDLRLTEMFGNFMRCHGLIKEGKQCPESLWLPLFKHIGSLIREAVKNHDNVVCTFAVCGAFGQKEIDAIVEGYADIKFVKIDVSWSELLERNWKRFDKFLKAKNLTLEQVWQSPLMAPYRGPKGDLPCTRENFDNAFLQRSKWMVTYFDSPQPNQIVIDNNDMKGYLQMDKIVDLPPADSVDHEAIAQINYARLALYNTKGFIQKERTFIMIKPDGVQRGLIGKIIERFEQKGFQLKAMKLCKPGKQHLEKHYADLAKKPFFPGLIEYMDSGPVCAMVWEGDDCILTGRKMLGATKPSDSEPGTIRGDFCIDVGRNIIHGSDSKDSAMHEIDLWFKFEEMCCYQHHSKDWIYEPK